MSDRLRPGHALPNRQFGIVEPIQALTLNEKADSPSSYAEAGRIISTVRLVAEQLQLAKTLSESGSYRMIKSAFFPNLTTGELEQFKAEAYKNAASARMVMTTRVGNPELKQQLTAEANALSDQADELLGGKPHEESITFDQVWRLLQLVGTVPIINSLRGNGDLDTLMMMLEHLPSDADKIAVVNEAMRVRRGQISEMQREQSPTPMHGRKETTVEIKSLQNSVEQARYAILQFKDQA